MSSVIVTWNTGAKKYTDVRIQLLSSTTALVVIEPGDLESVVVERSDPMKRGEDVADPGTVFTSGETMSRFLTWT